MSPKKRNIGKYSGFVDSLTCSEKSWVAAKKGTEQPHQARRRRLTTPRPHRTPTPRKLKAHRGRGRAAIAGFLARDLSGAPIQQNQSSRQLRAMTFLT